MFVNKFMIPTTKLLLTIFAITITFGLISCKKDKPIPSRISGEYKGTLEEYNVYAVYDSVGSFSHYTTSVTEKERTFSIKHKNGTIEITQKTEGGSSVKTEEEELVSKTDSTLVYETRSCAYHCNYNTYTFTKENGEYKLHYKYFNRSHASSSGSQKTKEFYGKKE